ncbi:MAG TPA: phasin family protein [Casimicrobiaceae bacterium]|nr:phasin family protein [Casimicrobiaceae bacterium]
MATRKTPGEVPRKTSKRARKSGAAKSAPHAQSSTPKAASATFAGVSSEQLADMARMANLLTPEQAIELYKANAKMALDVINAAIDNTAKLRKLQYEGEETAREFGRRTARGAAAAAGDPQSLAAFGQEAGREALETSLAYWGEMFDLIVEMQKRLFTLLNDQADSVPGFRQAKAAMAMMPDIGAMKNVVNAMQGMIGSGTGAFSSMQKMMADMARMAQSSMPGSR